MTWDIPVLMRQTLINLSVRLGLDFEEGWRYPLTVRFTDGSPRGAENTLAYVILYTDEKGIRQDLFINLTAYKERKFNFEKVLAHELVHAMLNDALGAEAMQIFPVWLNEGLAVYGADQGEKMAQAYVYQYTGFAEGKLINGLEGPHRALDYAEDYWAIKYIPKRHGPNALRLFVDEIVYRKGDVEAAYKYLFQEDWDKFLEGHNKFSKEEIKRIGPAQRGKKVNPY